MRNLLGAGRGVVVDLTEAEFIDSSVITAVLAGDDEAGTPAGDRVAIVVSGDGTIPDRVVSLLCLDQMIPTFTSREAAARAVGRDGGRADG
jgi:anti-anti-sigma regulatory factor